MRAVPILFAVWLASVGCSTSTALFPDDVPRSPYQRYSNLQMTGGRTHNGTTGSTLRQRLAPLEQP